jgi:N-methylhydantoinase A
MTSNGGMRSIDEAARGASLLALSGPAGGVVGAAAIAPALKVARALTIDIGGTSADVGLVLDGAPLVEPGGMVADVPIASPRVLVETVSAGGGSIAWIDDGGALRVGPHSAGAVPGPAAFGRGSTRATVTDAHVALGNIEDARMSGGVSLDVEAARESIASLARRLRAPERRVAQAIVSTADAAMARALRRVSVERGVDPRECVLIAFGGGGPLHACGLAELLGMSRVIVPPHAGVLSALGLAMASERRERMAGVSCRLDQWDDEARRETLEALAREFSEDLTVRQWLARARFVGQGHELDVPLSPAMPVAQVAKRFARLHQQRYGFTLDAPIEIVSVRHVAERPGRPVRFARGGKAGRPVRGPHTVALHDATLFVKHGWRARCRAGDCWEMTRR